MFERFTEKARRAVFFARYEASQYGHRTIETEHLLLGLWREDITLRRLLNDSGSESKIRAEIEKTVVRGESFGTSVEVPLSADARQALLFAAEEAQRLAQPNVGSEHILLGILRVEDSLGAQIIRATGIDAAQFRLAVRAATPHQSTQAQVPVQLPLRLLEAFLEGLKSQKSDDLMPFFAVDALMVDVHGKRWGYKDISEGFETLFAPYAKKNATYVIEETLVHNDHLVAVVLWKNALVASMERVWMHRMTIVITRKADTWSIVSIQATPVQP